MLTQAVVGGCGGVVPVGTRALLDADQPLVALALHALQGVAVLAREAVVGARRALLVLAHLGEGELAGTRMQLLRVVVPGGGLALHALGRVPLAGRAREVAL